MKEKKNPAATPTILPALSAQEVHRSILQCRALRNQVDRRLLDLLRILVEENYSKDLQAAGPVHYVMLYLGDEKSDAYQLIQVVRALDRLPGVAAAFEAGKISLSQFKAIASVEKADASTEGQWIEFAMTHNANQLWETARDAQRRGRKGPRKGGSGLLNRRVAFGFKLSLADREMVRKAFERKAFEMVESRQAERGKLTKEDVLLALCQEIHEKELPGDASERKRAFCDLVFHICADCGERRLLSPEGPIEVSEEYVARFEGSARKVEVPFYEEFIRGEPLPEGEVAGEVPVDVERKVLALSGRACAHCGRKLGIHIHHVIFRSHGGSNEIPNLLCVCADCHQGLHDRVLEVFRDRNGDFYWKRRADRLTALYEEEVEELAEIARAAAAAGAEQAARAAVMAETSRGQERPAIEISADPGIAIEGAEAPAREESPAEPRERHREANPVELEGEPEAVGEVHVDPAVRREAEDVERGLEQLGFTRKEAERRVARALEILGKLGRPLTGDEILSVAIRERFLRTGVTNSKSVESSGGSPGTPAVR